MKKRDLRLRFLKYIVAVLFLFFACSTSYGKEHLVSVAGEVDVTVVQAIDSIICEFGLDIRKEDAERAFRLLKAVGKKNHCTSVLYKTIDPKGNEVIASGLIAYPSGVDKYRGVVEVAPYNREKSLAGSKRMYTTEITISMLGYIVLIPDTIGYGATEDLAIPYVLTENAVQVSADLRCAAMEYFRQKDIEMPRKTVLFGYSLGAPTSLALAYYYLEHPEYNADVKSLCIGSGAYDPALSLDGSLQSGRMDYLVYPGIVHGLNEWLGLNLDVSKLFVGAVLEDYDLISGGTLNNKKLTDHYGNDLHLYMHPDFFSPEGNDDIARLKQALAEEAYPFGNEPLPTYIKTVIRHSREDTIVPVACSDQLFEQLRKGRRKPVYHRDKKGTHYEAAVRSFLDLLMLLL